MLSLNLTTLLRPFKPSQCSMKKICLTEKCVLNLTSLQVTYLISYKILKPNLPYKQTFEIGPHGKSTSSALQLHTRRFDSQFPIFSNPILNSNFNINADPGSTQVSDIMQNSVESCTNLRFGTRPPIRNQALFYGQRTTDTK